MAHGKLRFTSGNGMNIKILIEINLSPDWVNELSYVVFKRTLAMCVL